MKISISFLILFLSMRYLYAQSLTREQAMVFARKLEDVNILSSKGRTLLEQMIKDNEFVPYLGHNPLDNNTQVSRQLTKTQLLIFLSEAFGSEFYYRSGDSELNNLINAEAQRLGRQLNASDYERLYKEFNQHWQQSVAFKMEQAIQVEGHLPQETKRFLIGPLSIPRMEDYGLISDKRSAIGKQCSRTLKDLLDIQLIDSTIYKEVLQEIKANKLLLETWVLAAAAERSLFYEDYDFNKQIELSFIEGLHRRGVLSDDGMRSLLDSYHGKEIKSKVDYIPYCNQAMVFEVNNYDSDPKVGYRQLFDKIKTLLPGFSFSNFRAALIDEEPWGGKLWKRDIVIEFDAGGNHYRQQSFYDFVRQEETCTTDADSLLEIGEDFYEGINRWLADQDLEQRLYYIEEQEKANEKGRFQFGLIVMTQKQAEAWGGYPYFLSRENHDNTFNTKGLAQLTHYYEAIGLFRHLSPQEMEDGKRRAASKQIDSYATLLNCFPKTLVIFDWESVVLLHPYVALTKELAAASRGAFLPVNIKDEFEAENLQNDTCHFSFEVKGRLYEQSLTMAGDWLNPGFLDLIEQALEENDVDGRFYYCMDNGQESGYMFLTQQQYEVLKNDQPDLFPDNSGDWKETID